MTLTITQNIYKALLAVSPVVSKDACRPHLHNVFVRSDGNTVELVATDGHRMHRAIVLEKHPACIGLLSVDALKADTKLIKAGLKASTYKTHHPRLQVAPLMHKLELSQHREGTEHTYFDYMRLALKAATLKPMLDFSGDAQYLADAFESCAKIDKTQSAYFTMPENEYAPATIGITCDDISFSALIMPKMRLEKPKTRAA